MKLNLSLGDTEINSFLDSFDETDSAMVWETEEVNNDFSNNRVFEQIRGYKEHTKYFNPVKEKR